MSNSLHKDLTGKTVKVQSEVYNDQLCEFVCEGGFGCLPFTNGEKIFGYWISDKSRDSIRGSDVEKIVE